MKTNLKFTLPMLALAATTTLISCSDNDIEIDEFAAPDPSKALIEFTSNDGNIAHRAALATRAGNLISFGGETKIAMRIKSEGKTETDIRYTVTEMKAEPATTCTDNMHKTAAGKVGDVQNAHDHVSYLDAASYRYWDDAFGRDGKLSIYAIAVPGKTDVELKTKLKGIKNGDSDTFNKGTKVSDTNPNWFTESTEDETFTWTLETTEQTGSTIAGQDICYSYNIRTRDAGDEKEKGVYRFFNNNGTWIFNEMKAGRLQWTPKTTDANETVGKFDQGHLIFHHALSKVTIHLKEAENTKDGVIDNKGFDNTINTDFQFASGTNVTLIDFPYENVFDLSKGDWKAYNGADNKHGNITKLQETTTVDTDGNPTNPITTRTVTGLVVPGKVLKDDTKNALHFVIDDNDYYVTCDQIATAIQTYYGEHLADGTTANPKYNATLAGFTTMKQGEHYEINITVAKTKIENITAQLVDWETVTSDPINPTNDYIKVSLEERKTSGEFDKYYNSEDDKYKFDIYRKASTKSALSTNYDSYVNDYNAFADYEWATGYTGDDNKASGKSFTSGNVWDTKWTWPNNLTYYHLRVAGNNNATSTTGSTPEVKQKTSTINGDYFEIKGGALYSLDYFDAIWGAPFTDVKTNGVNNETTSEKFVYTADNGFDKKSKDSDDKVTWSQIYKAIGATSDKINMMLFHMTSQITVNVTTTTGTDKVVLRTGVGSETDPYTQTKVEILRFYQNGTVLMGNGKVDVTGDITNEQKISFADHTEETTSNGAISTFKYGVVPQILNRFTSGTDGNSYKVGLRITTPDGNQYVIQDISEVYGEVSNTNLQIPYADSKTAESKTLYKINRWYPGYKYTYTVTIKKTGIESITAQLVDWETVKGDLGTITLEK